MRSLYPNQYRRGCAHHALRAGLRTRNASFWKNFVASQRLSFTVLVCFCFHFFISFSFTIMFGLQQLFLGRRRREERLADDQDMMNNPVKDDDDDDDDDDALKQPPTKKIKTGHNNNNDSGGERRLVDPSKNEAVILARKAVFSIPSLLENIVESLDNRDELQLAACDCQLYLFFATRASVRFASIYGEADPDQQSPFVCRTFLLAESALPVDDRPRLVTKPKPSHWQSMWMWLRGERRPPRWLKPNRYLLQSAYMVPVDLQEGFLFGPSCSYGDRLYCLAAAGIVVTMDAEPKPLAYHWTRQAEPSPLSLGYTYIFDKLWYCTTSTTTTNNNNSKGFLVLKHQPDLRRGHDIRVMDLSQTNQDIDRADSKTGMDHRRITPSGTFYTESGRLQGEVVVSERDGLIFFVGGFDGTLSIESYDMTGQLVALTRKVAEVRGFESHEYRNTISVVTQHKLVVVYHTENPVNDSVTDYGFGIYVFDCYDLSFCGYTPLFGNYEIYATSISKDWLFYHRPEMQSQFALRITGGNVGQSTAMDLGNSHNDVLIAGNHIYAHTSREEGNIEFDQFDLLTGNKIRTLRTGIPWNFDDDGTAFLPLAGPAVDGEVRRLSRTVAKAHVVGNKVVFLISSVGSAKNTIVTFALPPSP